MVLHYKCRTAGSSGKQHSFGTIKLKQVKNIYGDNYGGEYVDLIDIREVKNYAQGNIKFKISINTSRFFMNEKTLASLLGAMLECGYDDYTFNGFSNEKGESVGGSTSHKNGYNGDLRFLRKDKSGKGVYLNKISEDGDPCGWKGMDEARQNKFNDALFRFGWKSMLCSYYTGKLLNNCTADEDHYDHLHVQSYTPDFKEVKE